MSRLFEAQQFPSIVFIASVEHRMLPLRRVDGLISAVFLKDQTVGILNALAENKLALEERLMEMSANQRVREEQDSAYNLSLELDAQKAVERELAEKAEQNAELARKKEEIRLKKLIEERRSLVDQTRKRLEENKYEGSDALKLSLQLPNGRNFVQSFSPQEKTSVLYDWAFTLVGEDPKISYNKLLIRTLMPPIVFECSSRSLLDVGVSNMMKLIIELQE